MANLNVIKQIVLAWWVALSTMWFSQDAEKNIKPELVSNLDSENRNEDSNETYTQEEQVEILKTILENPNVEILNIEPKEVSNMTIPLDEGGRHFQEVVKKTDREHYKYWQTLTELMFEKSDWTLINIVYSPAGQLGWEWISWTYYNKKKLSKSDRERLKINSSGFTKKWEYDPRQEIKKHANIRNDSKLPENDKIPIHGLVL